jgi:hypothetical protein
MLIASHKATEEVDLVLRIGDVPALVLGDENLGSAQVQGGDTKQAVLIVDTSL